MFIDKLEIEEVLGQYYDFMEMSEEDWERADKEIERVCRERGIVFNNTISEEDNEVYWKICDGVIGKMLAEE